MKRRTRKRSLATPDLTPLIDVVFLLLIFFMLVTTFDRYNGFNLELPTMTTGVEVKKDLYEIVIDADKKFYLKVGEKREEITLENISEKLKNIDEVILTADKNLTYETIIETMNTLKNVGVDKVELNLYE